MRHSPGWSTSHWRSARIAQSTDVATASNRGWSAEIAVERRMPTCCGCQTIQTLDRPPPAPGKITLYPVTALPGLPRWCPDLQMLRTLRPAPDNMRSNHGELILAIVGAPQDGTNACTDAVAKFPLLRQRSSPSPYLTGQIIPAQSRLLSHIITDSYMAQYERPAVISD